MTNADYSLDSHWMPFTANRQFKAKPRQLVAADGMYYRSDDNREILDGTAGLWCCNAGHNRAPIVEAIRLQAGVMDYAPPFQMGHPGSFELANQLVPLTPLADGHAFFCNSGSEAVDTALKMALAYQRAIGQGTRTRLIGRERGYHGVGFGGISVGGMVANRRTFGTMLSGVDHLRHTHDLARNAYTRGEPLHGAELADDLERLVALHDASTIAAVIVEPVAGSTGVLVPPVGYLARLREICDRHGILLIFDEVITGFGRLGSAFGANRFGVLPDMITMAKGLTSGTVPMGAVVTRRDIMEAMADVSPSNAIELFHGYTYSGHPLACAAARATLQLYADEALFDRVAALAPIWEDRLHGLRGRRNVIDIRNLGLIGGLELAPREGAPGARAYDVFVRCFENGLLVRTTGDIVALSPPFIIAEDQIDRVVEILGEAIDATA